MGKGTDKLYLNSYLRRIETNENISQITHSEWASEDAFSASVGAGAARQKIGGSHAPFKRLPFNFCSLSLQPFSHPVCTSDGIIFDLTHILPWIKKNGTNPVNGAPMKNSDLIKLHFAKNESGEYVDPVTYKVFTDNTHIVALGNTGNVFAWDTVQRLNIKPKMWRDLVNDEEFGRKDIITLQDPHNVNARDLSTFKYLKDGEKNTTSGKDDQGINLNAMGSSAKILRAKEAVAKARAEREQKAASVDALSRRQKENLSAKKSSTTSQSGKPVPFNAARHTTGLAAASFTSTGLTPHTAADLSIMTDEEYMLKRGRVKIKGYARIVTNLGDLNIELHTEHAPKAVWNFIQLAKKGYYKGVTFHRNIKGFMIQGGDPTGTGKGGESIWGKSFADEVIGPFKHDSRGTLSMANKGKDTNSSQFFFAYRAVPHLNGKHTIFGHLIDDPSPSSPTLDAMEVAPVDSSTNRPTPAITMLDVVVFVDPFEEFLNKKREEENAQQSASGASGDTKDKGDDDQVTWTGKRLRGHGSNESSGASGDVSGVGKYLKASAATSRGNEDEIIGLVDEDEPESEHARKKIKNAGRGGFGNFDSW
ncbi:hypothetical protein H109_00107 [Trichophyton interdigitale MR816]|uniref:Peptidyl-prolyl cis-trans isomerase-like 2 n=1 Tax=Trichophyton interdigitale (strain MR816) TaxID=1215338 RepID=A0A059JKY5_TRIIM|nr:hypothetical protein H101_03665 [Trichophyton interdigitale H6]KDB28127.1 hypothetical protein H109_00107 [Trichophyton interdigitale MR816]